MNKGKKPDLGFYLGTGSARKTTFDEARWTLVLRYRRPNPKESLYSLPKAVSMIEPSMQQQQDTIRNLTARLEKTLKIVNDRLGDKQFEGEWPQYKKLKGMYEDAASGTAEWADSISALGDVYNDLKAILDASENAQGLIEKATEPIADIAGRLKIGFSDVDW